MSIEPITSISYVNPNLFASEIESEHQTIDDRLKTFVKISKTNPSVIDVVQDIIQHTAETSKNIADNMCMTREERETLEKRRDEDVKRNEMLDERLKEEMRDEIEFEKTLNA